MKQDIKVYDKAKCEEIKAGELSDGVFLRRVMPWHYMYKVKGYGIQETVIQLLIEKKAELVVIQASAHTYWSCLSDWLAPDIKMLDFGHGPQRFLPVARMEIIE